MKFRFKIHRLPRKAGQRTHRIPILIALAIMSILLASTLLSTVLDLKKGRGALGLNVLDEMEDSFSDYKFVVRQWLLGRSRPDPRVGIVAIDEKTIEELGRWPFSRHETARLVRALKEQGAAVAAFDVVFADVDTSAQKNLGRLSRLYDDYRNLGLGELEVPDPVGASLEAMAREAETIRKGLSSLGPEGRRLDEPMARLTEAQRRIEQQTEKFRLRKGELEKAARDFRRQLEDSMGLVDYDQELADAVADHGHIVLGYFFFMKPSELQEISRERQALNRELIAPTKVVSIRLQDQLESIPDELMRPVGLGAQANLEKISRASAYHGFFNAFQETDGTVRNTRLLLPYEGDLYPSLALAAYKAYRDSRGEDGQIDVELNAAGFVRLMVGDREVPVSQFRGEMIVNYQGIGKTFPHYSWADVVNHRLPPGSLEGKLLFVGATAVGLYDLRVTPLSEAFPGVEIHANILANLLEGNFIHSPFWLRFVEQGIFVLLGFLSTYLLIILPPIRAFLSGVGLLFIYLVSVFALFTYANVDVQMVAPVLGLSLILFGIIVYRYFTEEKDKRFIKGAFSQYLSPAVIDQLVNDPSRLNLGGEERVCTAFFSDVAKFSTISEGLSPTELVSLLNEYLTEMTTVILEAEGTVDKYEGDAIIAFFGAPLDYADHAARACIASIRQQRRLAELRRKWKSEGRPELTVRVGLNTGRMLIGNMGSSFRMDYTMMGDAVNLASRLEGANKPYGTSILVSEFTWEGAKNAVEGREIDKIRVVGKAQPVTVHEVIEEKGRLDAAMQGVLGRYTEGLSLYKDRRFEAAQAAFEAALAMRPKDGPSMTYLERCRLFIANPPAPDWDGVFTLTEK